MPTTTRAAVLAVVVIPALACAFMLLMYHALLKVAPTWFIGCTSIGPPDYSCSGAHWDVEWVPDPCAGPPPPPHPGDVTSSANPTLMHAFYMSLAFGVFTPLGSVSFSTVRGVLGLSPWAAKCFHGLFKCAAITFSILGFLQQYYGSGGACNKSGKDNHFASMHSFFGLIVLIAYWLLGPSALVFLSNTSVLKPGSYWRMEFRRYHMFVGTFAVMGGLASILTGILDMEGKRVDPDDADFVMLPFWWPLARAGFVCMALAFALAWALYEGRVPVTPSRKGTLGEVSPLIVPLSSASEARFSLAEVAVHCTADDCWIVVHGKVYDVTDFLPDHPGGSHLLLAYKGGVADEGFDRNHELSVLSHALRPHTLMGVLNDAPKDVEANAIPPTSLQPAQGIRLAAASSAAPHAFLDRHRQSLVLGARFELSHDVVRFRLILPPERRLLGLPVGKHLKVYAPNTRAVVGTQWNGRNDPEAHAAEIERKYTPTTSDDDIGFVDLVIKVYRGGENERFPDGGKMSQYLDSLKIGSVIAVSGPWGSHEYLGGGRFDVGGGPDGARVLSCSKLGLMAGGTGITPMLQVMAAVLKDPLDTTAITLLYANQSEDDILVREELEALAAKFPARLKVWYTVDRPPASGWHYSTGFITAEMIQAHLPPPGEDTLILMCGPPPMVKFACQKNLDALGYPTERQVAF